MRHKKAAKAPPRASKSAFTPAAVKPALRAAVKAFKKSAAQEDLRCHEARWGTPFGEQEDGYVTRVALDESRSSLSDWVTHFYSGGKVYLCHELGTPLGGVARLAARHYLRAFPLTFVRGGGIVGVSPDGSLQDLTARDLASKLGLVCAMITFTKPNRMPSPEELGQLHCYQLASMRYAFSSDKPGGEVTYCLVAGQPKQCSPVVLSFFRSELAAMARPIQQVAPLGLVRDMEGGFRVAYKRGYDAASRVYVSSDLADLSDLSEAFTPESALKLVNRVLSAWVFATKTDKLNALESQIAHLTNSLGVIHPVTMVNALEIQSGKTHLGRLAHVALTGEAPPQPSYPDPTKRLSDAEFNAAAVQEPLALLMDNIDENVTIGGSYLEALITATGSLSPHVLGRGNVSYRPLGILFLFTGNRIQMTPDMRRRSRIIDIRRRTRTTGGAIANKGSFVDRMQAHPRYRHLYVAALLRLIQYWVDSGCPPAPIGDRNFPIDAQVTGGITALAASIGGRESFVRKHWKATRYLSPWEQEMEILLRRWPKRKGKAVRLPLKDVLELVRTLELPALWDKLTNSARFDAESPRGNHFLARNIHKFPQILPAGTRARTKHYRPAPQIEPVGDRLEGLKWIKRYISDAWVWLPKTAAKIQREIGPLKDSQLEELHRLLVPVVGGFLPSSVCSPPDWEEICKVWPQQESPDGMEYRTILLSDFLVAEGWHNFPKAYWADVEEYEDIGTGKPRICPKGQPVEYL